MIKRSQIIFLCLVVICVGLCAVTCFPVLSAGKYVFRRFALLAGYLTALLLLACGLWQKREAANMLWGAGLLLLVGVVAALFWSGEQQALRGMIDGDPHGEEYAARLRVAALFMAVSGMTLAVWVRWQCWRRGK